MNELYLWAVEWGIPTVMLNDLLTRMGAYAMEGQPTERNEQRSEAAVQNNVRLEASRKGVILWRNNNGGDGKGLRWGLANDSAKVNAVLKSSDLIGIRPMLIEQHHVGRRIGQFVAREVKRSDWFLTGTPEEEAQFAFIKLVNSLGGDAQFTNREGTI